MKNESLGMWYQNNVFPFTASHSIVEQMYLFYVSYNYFNMYSLTKCLPGIVFNTNLFHVLKQSKQNSSNFKITRPKRILFRIAAILNWMVDTLMEQLILKSYLLVYVLHVWSTLLGTRWLYLNFQKLIFFQRKLSVPVSNISS